MLKFIGLFVLLVCLYQLPSHTCCLSVIQECISSAAFVPCLDVFSLRPLSKVEMQSLGFKFFKYSKYEKIPNDMAMDCDDKNTYVPDIITLG